MTLNNANYIFKEMNIVFSFNFLVFIINQE